MRKRIQRTAFSIALALLAAGLVAPQAVPAQDTGETWTFDARGGISFPAGDFEDLPFESVNPTAGVGATYWLSPRFGVQVSGDWELYLGDDSELAPGVTTEGGDAPDMNVYHYSAAFVVDLASATSPWDLQVNVGGGGTTYDSDEFSVGGANAAALESFSETYASASGGVKLGYDLSRAVNVFVGGQAYLAFPEEEDTGRLAQLSPEAQTFDTAWTFPVLAGVKVEF